MTDDIIAQKRYLIRCYYIGKSKYYGSQLQPSYSTIEGRISLALKEKKYIEDSNSTRIEFASRTDRFVSAKGACFSLLCEKKPILMEINSELPKEIGVWAHSEVPIDFSARHNAIQRHYRYIFPQPLTYLTSNSELELDIIKRACNDLKGIHNFINFSKRAKEDVKTERTMDDANVSIINDFLIFDFKSRGFLRQQVRRMIRKLMELGQCLIKYDEFLELFNPEKEVSFQPADPEGLILWDVKYDKDITFQIDLKSKERMENYFLNQELKKGLKKQLFHIL